MVPAQLRRGPFTLEEARATGLTRKHWRGKSWKRLGRGLYCWTEWGGDHWTLLSAWKRLLPEEAVFAGVSAAWLLGLDLEPDDPIDVIVKAGSGVRSRPGLNVRHQTIQPEETIEIRGLRATRLPRTLCDLCARLPTVDALIALDMALFKKRIDAGTLIAYAAKGRPGAARLRRTAALAAPAESPMETRLRWLLLRRGLPKPEVQTDLRDADGRFLGRADLYYPGARLIIEYDGTNHRDRLVQDNRRQNLLLNAGFRLLRFTAQDVLGRPDSVVSQVRSLLESAS